MVSITPGFSAEQIREFVYEYQLQPHGQKGLWLAAQGVSVHRFRLWVAVVFEGDLDRGLIPRQGSPMTVPPGKRTALERQRAAERAAHETEIARLATRVRELEETNTALGKAIGLLHAINVEEPADSPPIADPSDS